MEERETILNYISLIIDVLGLILSLSATIVGGITSNVLIFLLGSIFTILLIFLLFKIKSYPKYTEIKGIRIEEADNIPLFVPRRNQMNPFKVKHICEINKTDAILEYEYKGICIDKQGMDYFSTSLYTNNNNNDLDNMTWFAYDLKNDSKKEYKLHPQLQTPRGSTKRVIFNFIRKIQYNEYCGYYTYQKVKNSVKEFGWDYYVSTVLYKKRPLHDYKVILKFHDIKPKKIEVYSIVHRKCNYLYELTDSNMKISKNTYIFTDNIENETAWSIRLYLFNRTSGNS